MKMFVLAAAMPLAASAFAQTTPVTTTYATTVMKRGCAPVVFTANAQGAPAVVVGQAMDVLAGGRQCSGYVVKVEHQFSLQRYATVEVRAYATTITLDDRPALPAPPPAP